MKYSVVCPDPFDTGKMECTTIHTYNSKEAAEKHLQNCHLWDKEIKAYLIEEKDDA